ncbi:MAG: nickel-dependent lactate racemase [Eubacteriales bacterium]|nr:nickel-dependent lactate racemase [Eubacteriales bacterium]
MKISIPYGSGLLECDVEDSLVTAVLAPAEFGEPERSGEALVLDALAHPVGSPPLRERANGKRRVTLITSDHTRAVPSRITLPLLLGEIRAGNPDAEITILIATGLHRATTREEQIAMFGEQIVSRERIAVSDAKDASAFVDLGPLPSGAPCEVHSLAANCDLLVSEGFIEPHFFAGYSGGRKSVLPGVCSERTINHNHAYANIAQERAASGILDGNPVHADMCAAARKAKLAFILNVTLDGKKRVTAAFAGDPEQAHAQGVRFAEMRARCDLVTGDIVLTGNGGFPLDQNLYQTAKAASTAALCAGKSGVIILCAACEDGVGGEHFEHVMTLGTPEEILAILAARPPEQTIPEQWNAQIYERVLKDHPLILVSGGVDPVLVRRMNMLPARSLSEALALARKICGERARIVAIPDGVAALPTGS